MRQINALKPFLMLAVGFILLSLNTSVARAQVYVFVDKQPVVFKGQPPIQQEGRVLVPLRGVLERLGAIVGYDGATKTVSAVRGDTRLALPVGSRRAVVGDRTVTLDVPAFIANGSVMVPLRFVSETLGARVNWDPNTSTVAIESGNTTLPSNPTAPQKGVYKGVFLQADRLSPERWRLKMTNNDSIEVPNNVPVYYGKDRIGVEDLWSSDEVTITLDPKTGRGTRVDVAVWE